MYKCEKCKKQVGPNIPETKVVTQKRDKRYINPRTGEETVGWEIVKEIKICPSCTEGE